MAGRCKQGQILLHASFIQLRVCGSTTVSGGAVSHFSILASYPFFLIFQPFAVILAASNKHPVKKIVSPENSCTPIQLPVASRIAPLTGVPHSSPKAEKKKHCPIRVPSLLISVVREVIATGGMLTNPPLKKPYRMAKMIVPERFRTPIQPSARMPVMREHGMRTLRGPA